MGLLAAAQVLGRLLHSDLLGIDELGLSEQELEGAAPITGLVHALQVLVLEFVSCLLFKEGKAASLALECGGYYLRPDLGGRPHQPVYGQELAYMVRAKLAGLEIPWKLDYSHMGSIQIDVHGQIQLQDGGPGSLYGLIRILHKLLCEIRIELFQV